MKRTILSRSLLIIMMIAAMGLSTVAWAQGSGQGRGKTQGMKKGNPEMHMKMMIPDLTNEQKDKIKSLRMEMMKKITPMKAQLKEKMAHLNTLSVAENVDRKAIDKTIEQIGKLRTEMMKIHANFRQEVRSLLTRDQRIVFDSKAGNMMGHGMKGHHGSKQGKPCRGM